MSLHQKQSVSYSLFSISNFLAAIGGGVVLGKGVGILDVPILQGSSLLAFFVGTAIGLMFLKCTPKKFSEIFSQWFSICGGITSIILCVIFIYFSFKGKLSGNFALLFFVLLSVRFGFWFYSRVLRVSKAAGQRQGIAWVELGYYSGVIIGLILWVFLGININITAALLVDAFLQLSAGILDLIENKISQKKEITSEKEIVHISSLQKQDKIWQWRLAFGVMFLTIGVQVVIFNLAHKVHENLSPYVLAIFYFGATISALFCKKFNVRLEWNVDNKITVQEMQLFYLEIILIPKNLVF